MARKRTEDRQVAEKLLISGRLRELRVELYGDRGGPGLAEKLGIPSRSWYNYEIGVTVPAEVLLRFLAITQAEPNWLLTGTGPKFRAGDAMTSTLSPAESPLVQAMRMLIDGEIRISWKPNPPP